ncbi:MAG: hypothetical protein RMK01_12150 [Thermomicrobium sp.]|nr:hypothetical protein [Thermomicrobium sp.]MDW8060815.1 hypothetical protein [Thermomicrobium sp.]
MERRAGPGVVVWLSRGAIACGALSAALGVLAGLARMGWHIPLPHRAQLTVLHGPLLVIGFFVTLIGLERAVAVGRRFMFAVPIAGIVAALVSVSGALALLGRLLALVASLAFLLTFGYLLAIARSVHHAVMFVGAFSWFVSGVRSLTGAAVPVLVPWWLTGFVLIITGERLELARALRPDQRIRAWFVVSVALLFGAPALESLVPAAGARLRGLALLSLALWLLRFDVARWGLHQHGLHRFSAVCLVHGYVWLAVAGLLMLLFGHQQSGFRYDAQIHALGFVFSQVFAHAYIIFPAVTGLRLPYRRGAYLAPAVLGASLLVRLAGDLVADAALRRVGGLGNAVALVVFVASIGAGIARSPISLLHRLPLD